LLAAKAGASYISPFVGRLDDLGEDGMGMVATLVQALSNYDYPTEVLVASVRGPNHFIQAAVMGADVATCPFKTIQQLMKHPLTDKGLASFLADWEKAKPG
jgi:transaldolase